MPSPALVNTVNQVLSAACERLANRVWAIVPQKPVRNMSIKDNPDTLPINLEYKSRAAYKSAISSRRRNSSYLSGGGREERSSDLVQSSGDIVYVSNLRWSTIQENVIVRISASTKKQGRCAMMPIHVIR